MVQTHSIGPLPLAHPGCVYGAPILISRRIHTVLRRVLLLAAQDRLGITIWAASASAQLNCRRSLYFVRTVVLRLR